jgi:hypothetical protein
MALIRKTNPRGIDVAIDKLQNYLFIELDNADYQSYPRAYKNTKNNGGVIPENYISENEYQEVFMDDNYSLSSFWLVDDNTTIDEFATTTVSVIFQVLLDEVYPTITHRADEEFINEVYNILYNNPYKHELNGVVRGLENVYAEFDTSQVTWDDISEYYVVRFDLEVTYDYLCE